MKNSTLTSYKLQFDSQKLLKQPLFTQMEDPIQLKDDGNKHFLAGEFDQAIDCYTKAVKSCKDKKVLSIIYRN